MPALNRQISILENPSTLVSRFKHNSPFPTYRKAFARVLGTCASTTSLRASSFTRCERDGAFAKGGPRQERTSP